MILKLNKSYTYQYYKYMRKQLDLLTLNPVQWAQEMIKEDTLCDLIFLMALRDQTDVSYTIITSVMVFHVTHVEHHVTHG